MEGFSKKVYLSLNMPEESAPISDQSRIQQALKALGYQPVTFPLNIIRKLYPLCRNAEFHITVSLVQRESDWIVVDVEPGDQTERHFGLAVDYGSTTIVMRMVDMNSGSIVSEESAVNGQVVYGTDILSRITYSLEDPTHSEHLQAATVETFHTLLAQLTASTGINAAKCPAMVISGNTTMTHFLLKLDAWTVFAAPYAPVVSDPGFFSGADLGMDYDGMVYIVPSASNYVGGPSCF